MDDLSLMRRTISLARQAGETGNLPFGALIARESEIVSEASNSVALDGDPTAHAELKAIRDACSVLMTTSLSGLRIFSSGEPCPMCLGAIYWSGLSELVYGSSRGEAAEAGLATAFLYEEVSKDPSDRVLPARRLAESEAAGVLTDFAKPSAGHSRREAP